jgi:hypothetical protein
MEWEERAEAREKQGNEQFLLETKTALGWFPSSCNTSTEVLVNGLFHQPGI